MQNRLIIESKNVETLYSLILEYINLPLLSKKEPEILDALLQIILYESDLESLREATDMMGEVLCDGKEDLAVKSKLLDLIFTTLIEKLGIPFIHMFETESFKKFFKSCEEKDNLLYFGAQKLIQAALQPIFLKYNGVDLSKILPDLSSRGEVELREPDRNDIFENMYCSVCMFILNPSSLQSQNPQETLLNAELAISQRVQTRYKREFLLELLQRLKTILSENSTKANATASSLTTHQIHQGHHFSLGEALPPVTCDFDYVELHPNQYKLTPEQSNSLGVMLCEMLNLKSGGTILLGVFENTISGLEINKRQREILLKDIEEVICRLRPVTASKRIVMEYIQVKTVESAHEKAHEKFVLKISVESSADLDTENNPYRLMARKPLLCKNWNISEIHFRQHINDVPPKLNYKEIVKYAAAEEYFKGIENVNGNTISNGSLVNSRENSGGSRATKKGFVCQIFIKTTFSVASQTKIKVLWRVPYDDVEEELELSPCEDSSTEMQTKTPIRVLQGQHLNR